MSDDNNDNRTELFMYNFEYGSILELLGSELVYDELEVYSRDIYKTVLLEITKVKFEDYSLVQIRINGNLILDREYYNGVNNAFIKLLDELIAEEQSEEEYWRKNIERQKSRID